MSSGEYSNAVDGGAAIVAGYIVGGGRGSENTYGGAVGYAVGSVFGEKVGDKLADKYAESKGFEGCR